MILIFYAGPERKDGNSRESFKFQVFSFKPGSALPPADFAIPGTANLRSSALISVDKCSEFSICSALGSRRSTAFRPSSFGTLSAFKIEWTKPREVLKHTSVMRFWGSRCHVSPAVVFDSWVLGWQRIKTKIIDNDEEIFGHLLSIFCVPWTPGWPRKS